MSGSSRTLLRDLNTVFKYWDSDFEKGTLQTSELFKSIRAFLDNHNTLQSIKQSTNIHHELYNFYTQKIQPQSQLSREIVFLEILTELSPVLSAEEVELWLKTYLRPAVDSANYDLEFVSKCRALMEKFFDYEGSDDPLLVQRREAIAIMVLQYTLDLYLLKDDSILDFIGLQVSDEEKHTQVFYERLRFIKVNARKFLCNFALTHPRVFGTVTNDHFIKVDERLDILALLSEVLNSRSSKLHALADVPLFENFFRCLSFDFDEKVLGSALSVLVMFVPLVSDKISAYVSDLMVILTRIVGWYSCANTIPDRIKRLRELFARQGQQWEIAVNTKTESVDKFTVDHRPVLDAGHLITVIYGLFPYSLVTFAESPIKYFSDHKPIFFDQSHLILIDNMMNQDLSPFDESQMNVLVKVTKEYIKGFRIHPNFLKPERLSIEFEVNNPTAWLVEDKDADSLGVEEIMIGCLSLNPAFGFYIPDTIDSSMVDAKSSGESSKRNSYSSNGNGNVSRFNSESRNSSVGSPLYMSFAHASSSPALAQSVFQRKLSIAPTNLVIDNKRPSEITFKDVDYERDPSTLNNSILSESSLASSTGNRKAGKTDRKGSDPIHELFSNHERLFHLNDAASVETLQPTKSSDVHSLLGNRVNSGRPQSSVASIDYTKETVFSTSTSTNVSTLSNSNSAIEKRQAGSPLDFYHRELLLMKNEFEFSSYMKHLNKFQYIKLRLQMNKLMKEQQTRRISVDAGDKTQDKGEPDVDFKSLTGEIEALKQERAGLVDKFMKLQEQASSIEEQLQEAQTENAQLKSQVDDLIKKSIPSKNEEIFNLNNKLKDVTNDYEILQKKLESMDVHNPNQAAASTTPASGDPEEQTLDDTEREAYQLRTEVSILQEKNDALTKKTAELEVALQDAIKASKAKVSSNKNEVAYQLGILANQYEKKVQELSTTVMKYESLVEEKNLKIAQLSSSQPISIPGSISMGSSRSNSHTQGIPFPTARANSGQTSAHNGTSANIMEFYESNRNNSSSSSESLSVNSQLPFNTPPLHTPNPMGKHFPSTGPQPVPIIKGRGGYQKRSKKHM